jgi:hypothetical protein
VPHPTPIRAPHPLPRPALDQIAQQIAEAHGGATHASLVRVRPRPTGLEVGLCALPEGAHPAEALLGHVVPPSWAASGVVAPAWARPVEEAAATGTGTRTSVVVVVGRDGHVASHAVGIDGIGAGGEPPVGRIPDLLHRTLGLPTPAPGLSAAEWWRAFWLDALVATAADAPDHAPDPDQPLTSTLPPELVQALVDEPYLCTEAGWSRLRRLAAAEAPPDAPGPAAVRAAVTPFVDPSVAAWFDDGSFARWLLDALPSVDELLELAAALVPSSTLALLHQVSGRAASDGDGPGRPILVPDGEPAPRSARGGAGPPR